MPKILITLLLLISIGSAAQTTLAQTETKLIIEVAKSEQLNTKANKILNVSDFIVIRNGDEIKLHPKLELLPSQHQFLKGLLKSTTTFALSYHLNKTINNNSKGNSSNSIGSTNIAPVLGISLATGLPNMLQGLKTKRTYLVYTLYDNNKIPLTTQKVLLNKRNKNNYTFDKATADGFLKVLVLSNNKRVIPGDLTILISNPGSANFKGGIAGEFELNSMGDCQSGGGDDGEEPSDPCRKICWNYKAAQIAVAYGTYTGAMLACTTLTFPPAVALCYAAASIAYGGAVALIMMDYQKCVNACPPN